MSRTLHRGDNVSGGAREKGRERERDEKGRERKCISLPRDTSRDETNVFSSTAFVFLEVHRIFFSESSLSRFAKFEMEKRKKSR